jgi:hypothetical protein
MLLRSMPVLRRGGAAAAGLAKMVWYGMGDGRDGRGARMDQDEEAGRRVPPGAGVGAPAPRPAAQDDETRAAEGGRCRRGAAR